MRHEALHEKHRGHETMHAEMVLILLASLVVSQIVLVYWKNAHFKSFQVRNLVPLRFFIKQTNRFLVRIVFHNDWHVDHSVPNQHQTRTHEVHCDMDHIHDYNAHSRV